MENPMPKGASLSRSNSVPRPVRTPAPVSSQPSKPALTRSNSAPTLPTGTSAKSDFKTEPKRPAPLATAHQPAPALPPEPSPTLFAQDLAARQQLRTGTPPPPSPSSPSHVTFHAEPASPRAPALKDAPAHWDK